MQAGELASPIFYNEILVSPDGSNWDHKNFNGKITFVYFLCDLPNANASFVSMWNEMFDEFHDRQCQFLSMALDSRADLAHWQQENPLPGWLLRDADWLTARSWGIERPQTAVIGKDTRILGFCRHPDTATLAAFAAGKSWKYLRPKPLLRGGGKPDLPPSYTVHISPSKRDADEGTSASSGPDHWSRPTDLNHGDRYDFELLLPKEKMRETLFRLVQQAIESSFG